MTSVALVVEDNPSLQHLIATWLENRGWQVLVASDGVAALEQLGQHAVDFVCLDLMLPRMSGLAVCEKLRGELGKQHLPVLVMSARGTPQDRALAEEAGADAYLTKPFKEAQFVAVLERLKKGRPALAAG
jgi:DNA-binding response OmpR family regulator